MALNYRPVDRDQPFLLPPDMRDWLPEDHLVWFLLEVIEQLDTRRLHARSKRGGTGREGYQPEMLLGLWIYASARGIQSSREIERACSEDVAFRVLCGQDVPDHTVLARFRQRHQDAMADLFAQVLALCVGQGLGRFGVIAIDGTKIRANASISRTVTLDRLRKLAAAELEKAAVTDAAEDAADEPAAGDDVPPGFGPGADRKTRIAAAIRDLERQVETENLPVLDNYKQKLQAAEERLAKREREAAEKVRRAEEAAARGARVNGRPPKSDPIGVRTAREGVEYARLMLEQAEKKQQDQLGGTAVSRRTSAKRNTTDPQSRIMKARDGFLQGYNAQLAVTDDGLILAAELTDHPTDVKQLQPMMVKAEQMIEHCRDVTGEPLSIGVVVADAGYLSDDNVDADGPARLIAPGRGRTDAEGWTGSTMNKNSRATKSMLAKLEDPANQVLYRRRAVTVEPVNGHLKDRRGLRRFATRGLQSADAELLMASMTTNLMKLFIATRQAPSAG
jgi:transposase